VTHGAMEFPFHNYSNIGRYTVTITGRFAHFGDALTPNDDLVSVDRWDENGVMSAAYAFLDATTLTSVAEPPSTVTDMSYMFLGATAFNQNIASWNTDHVTDMTGMFQNASSFRQDLSGWTVALIPTMPSNWAAPGFPAGYVPLPWRVGGATAPLTVAVPPQVDPPASEEAPPSDDADAADNMAPEVTPEPEAVAPDAVVPDADTPAPAAESPAPASPEPTQEPAAATPAATALPEQTRAPQASARRDDMEAPQ